MSENYIVDSVKCLDKNSLVETLKAMGYEVTVAKEGEKLYPELWRGGKDLAHPCEILVRDKNSYNQKAFGFCKNKNGEYMLVKTDACSYEFQNTFQDKYNETVTVKAYAKLGFKVAKKETKKNKSGQQEIELTLRRYR
jgi:hypothetical protein